ncbi:MAG: bluetail domain-containing putative surface protein, partial [Cyanobium sp.]
ASPCYNDDSTVCMMFNFTAAPVDDAHRHAGHDASNAVASSSAVGTAATTPGIVPVATKASDRLSGVSGAKDQFTLRKLRHSLLKDYDVITNYEAADSIDAPGLKSLQMLAGSDACPVISALSAKAIQRECCDRDSFLPHQICGFTVEGLIGAFVVINDKRPGFDARRDAVLFLAGFMPNNTDMVHAF